MSDTLKYRGDQRAPGHPHPQAHAEPEPYVAAPDLIAAVNLAIYFRRPLLLEGEAGCGKTRLAYAVAYELGLPVFRWNVRSASKVHEGLYAYDYILRLHDVQLRDRELPTDRDPRRSADYLTFGELGKALQPEHAPAVVLIDEIDKADRDFPNDLLGVLDEWAFAIHETGQRVAVPSGAQPIVIITSNQEKGDLPDPFLRRCIYHFIDFPEEKEDLVRIIDVHFPTKPGKRPARELIDQAVDRFIALRGEGLRKKPGTSELLDWLRALHMLPATGPRDLTQDPLEYPGLLLKLRADWLRHGRRR